MATSELVAWCFSNGRALPTNRREQRAIELLMRETAEPFSYRPPLDANKRPDWLDRADLDLDCNGMQLKAGS